MAALLLCACEVPFSIQFRAGSPDAASAAAPDDAGPRPDASEPGDAGTTLDATAAPDTGPSLPWGSYAASLAIPECPSPALELLVDTASDELDGGETITEGPQAGAFLSLREALWIAANVSGPKTIRFSSSVFPVTTPATIELSNDLRSPVTLVETCIDGRDRGVVIRWQPSGATNVVLPWNLTDSYQLGLTLLNIPHEQSVVRSQIAGCRLDTDGWTLAAQGARPWIINMHDDALLGPGNVVAAPIRVYAGATPAQIRGSFFGFDPLTRVNLVDLGGSTRPLDIRAGLIAEDNVFAVADLNGSLLGEAEVTFRNNFFGVDRASIPLPGTRAGISLQSGTGVVTPHVVLGPGNVIRAVASAISISRTLVTITQNSVTGNETGIAFVGTPPVAAPVVAAADEAGISGSCVATGTIELFVDAGDQGELYLASTPCDAAGGFRVSVDFYEYRAKGQNLTATLTDSTGSTSPFSQPFPL
ncbi:MAG: hypothetical protein HY901_16870 [Deltaproteobacteria bacterium]|nr:hypothetical protein [Deltaproteobacteria bacterium]